MIMSIMYSLEAVHEEAGAEAALKVIKKIIKEGEADRNKNDRR